MDASVSPKAIVDAASDRVEVRVIQGRSDSHIFQLRAPVRSDPILDATAGGDADLSAISRAWQVSDGAAGDTGKAGICLAAALAGNYHLDAISRPKGQFPPPRQAIGWRTGVDLFPFESLKPNLTSSYPWTCCKSHLRWSWHGQGLNSVFVLPAQPAGLIELSHEPKSTIFNRERVYLITSPCMVAYRTSSSHAFKSNTGLVAVKYFS